MDDSTSPPAVGNLRFGSKLGRCPGGAVRSSRRWLHGRPAIPLRTLLAHVRGRSAAAGEHGRLAGPGAHLTLMSGAFPLVLTHHPVPAERLPPAHLVSMTL